MAGGGEGMDATFGGGWNEPVGRRIDQPESSTSFVVPTQPSIIGPIATPATQELVHETEDGEYCQGAVKRVIANDGTIRYLCTCGKRWKSSETAVPI
jgi:hypothetical protein